MQTFDESIQGVIEALKTNEIGECAAWCNYFGTLSPIRHYFRNAGAACYDRDVLTAYRQSVDTRFRNGEICRSYYWRLIKGVELLREYCETGQVVWRHRNRGTKYGISDDHKAIIADFIGSTDYTENTQGDIWWVLQKYLCFVTAVGVKELSDIQPKHLECFIADCAKKMTGGSLSNVRGYVKVFHHYLQERGTLSGNFDLLLNAPIPRGKHIHRCLTQAELAAILAQINRETSKGKRDYAIILLGMICGLRAHDIVHLKMTDTNWSKGEIRVVQQKTQHATHIPLTKIVGMAIQEYILCGRPPSKSEYLFLRLQEPYQRLSSGVPIGFLFNEYQQKAGIERTAFDGKGFHSLRRSMGKNMVQSNISVETVAQVLGHEDLAATQRYIALDTGHLRDCALNVSDLTAEV